MPIRMLSLRRPGLLVYSCVDFVRAIQDPRHMSKVEQIQSQMVEVFIDMSPALFTTYPAIIYLYY